MTAEAAAGRPDSSSYQLDFVTPGISPASASSLKHRRQSWNFLRYPRGRPHRWQRWYARALNLGLLLALAIKQVLATITPLFRFGTAGRSVPPVCRPGASVARASTQVPLYC
jgi:hypothetical protein